MKNKYNKPYIIAETACAHDGSLMKLIKMIYFVGNSNAQSIQFRVFSHKNTITKNHPDFKKIKKLVLTKDEWIKCFNYTKKKYPNLEIISSIPSSDELIFSDKLGADAFKLHSADLDNYELLEATSKIGKRIDLSVGASTLAEIKNAVNFIKNKNKNCKIWLLYGYQLFPTKPEKLNLKRILKLKKLFNLNVGYQDHSVNDHSGYAMPTLAIGLGINIIEKHITDNAIRQGTDSISAIDGKDFKQFVQICNNSFNSIGNGKFGNFSKDEQRYRIYCKKNLFVSKNLKKGSILNKEDIILRRSHKIGINAGDLKKIIGKKLTVNLKIQDQLYYKHLEKN